MKITGINAYPISFKPGKPFANSGEWHTSRATTLVKISTDEGLVGWGEAYGPPLGISNVIEKFLRDKLIGEDPLKLEYFWYKLQVKKGIPKGAIGGVDIALWDLKAKYLNVPVYELLGGKFIDAIVPYATGFFYSEEKEDSTYFIEKEAQQVKDSGYKSLKIKIGFGIERDIQRLRKVREIVGDTVNIMVDANQAYNVLSCLHLAPYLSELNVGWLEEPIPWTNFQGYKELKSKLNIAIAAGESEITYQGFIEAISNRIVDVIQPDLAGSGGLTIVRKIAVLAEAFQVEFQPHVFGTVICLPAAVQLMTSLPNNQSWCTFPRAVTLEWDTTPNDMIKDILMEPLKLTNGVLNVTDKVGLGVEINEEAIKHYLMG